MVSAVEKRAFSSSGPKGPAKRAEHASAADEIQSEAASAAFCGVDRRKLEKRKIPLFQRFGYIEMIV